MLDRLRRALEGSAEQPRPVAHFDLPLNLGYLITPAAVAKLKPAAVLIPILRRDSGDTLLLTRRAETLRQHKGQISFPGGRRDGRDASLADAALREAEEEVGLAPASVELLGYLDDYPTFTGYCITPVVGLISGAFSPRIDPGEVAEAFEVPLDLVLAEDRFERKSLPRGGIDLPFYELQYGDYRIWGATAGILWNLRERVIRHG
ncbi:MAG: hypothetical protein NVS9B10_13780 [Nevskia sp.]